LSKEQIARLPAEWKGYSLGTVGRHAAGVWMDEFAIQKGQRYATVFVEPPTKRGLRAPTRCT